MRRQGNMSQMKEQNKTPEKELNRMEASNPPNAEFKMLIIRMFNELRGGVDELSENFNKEIGNIKIEIENTEKNQSEMKNTITEMNTLEEINSILDEAENQISD